VLSWEDCASVRESSLFQTGMRIRCEFTNRKITGARKKDLRRIGVSPYQIMRKRGLEPPRDLTPTRPSTWRVCQFRHLRFLAQLSEGRCSSTLRGEDYISPARIDKSTMPWSGISFRQKVHPIPQNLSHNPADQTFQVRILRTIRRNRMIGCVAACFQNLKPTSRCRGNSRQHPVEIVRTDVT
jgi:hypothetical protein